MKDITLATGAYDYLLKVTEQFKLKVLEEAEEIARTENNGIVNEIIIDRATAHVSDALVYNYTSG